MRHLLLLVLFISYGAHAEKHMLVLGGGGEPKSATTIFDHDFKALGLFNKNNPDYKTKIAFNGGHSATEKIAGENFSSFDQSNHFTSKAFEALIKSYEDKIKSGEIKSGDQLLIHINSHGSANKKDTHDIATAEGTITNFDTLGSSTVSLDRLKSLTKLAEKQGIKLGIIDLSCHSGNSLALANSKTCVITSTGPNHYAYGGGSNNFSASFNKNLAKGKSLDQVFLESRASYADLSFPMISSPQGIDVQKKLYDPLTPYLYTFESGNNKFLPFMEEKAGLGEKCDLHLQHQSLIDEADGILKITDDVKTRPIVENFKKSVKDYYDYLEDIRKKMVEAGFSEMKKKYTFCTEVLADKKKKIKAGKECLPYSVENLLSLDFELITGYYEKTMTGTANDQAHTMATIENFKKAKIQRDEILKAHPQYSKYQKFWSSLPGIEHQTSKLAWEVTTAQKKIYDHLYKESKAPGPNPCKDFVL